MESQFSKVFPMYFLFNTPPSTLPPDLVEIFVWEGTGSTRWITDANGKDGLCCAGRIADQLYIILQGYDFLKHATSAPYARMRINCLISSRSVELLTERHTGILNTRFQSVWVGHSYMLEYYGMKMQDFRCLWASETN
jgi:hypothetical protein